MTGVLPLTVLLLASSGFIALVVAVLVGTLPAEAAVRHALLGWASPAVVAVLDVVNLAGDWRLILPGALVIFAIFPHARARWWVWLGLIIATPLAESITKHLIGRTRPEDLSLGFPSGHVTAAAAFFGALGYLVAALPSRGVRLAVRTSGVLIVLLVALARVLLRAHWPSDALGGAALGLALASAAALAAQVPAGEDR
ncbi:MAG: phosphatase PAP2 family protein [Candidatus Rokuibacteriota bacterium]